MASHQVQIGNPYLSFKIRPDNVKVGRTMIVGIDGDANVRDAMKGRHARTAE